MRKRERERQGGRFRDKERGKETWRVDFMAYIIPSALGVDMTSAEYNLFIKSVLGLLWHLYSMYTALRKACALGCPNRR